MPLTVTYRGNGLTLARGDEADQHDVVVQPQCAPHDGDAERPDGHICLGRVEEAFDEQGHDDNTDKPLWVAVELAATGEHEQRDGGDQRQREHVHRRATVPMTSATTS